MYNVTMHAVYMEAVKNLTFVYAQLELEPFPLPTYQPWPAFLHH